MRSVWDNRSAMLSGPRQKFCEGVVAGKNATAAYGVFEKLGGGSSAFSFGTPDKA